MELTDELVEELYKLVGSFVKKHRKFYSDYEEAVQDIVTAILPTFRRDFDPSKSKLSTYVYVLCRYKYLNDLSAKTRRKQILTVSLDDLVPEISDSVSYADIVKSDASGPLENILDEEKEKMVSEIYNNASNLLKDYLSGEKQFHLAKKYNLSQASVSRKIKTEIMKYKKEVNK